MSLVNIYLVALTVLTVFGMGYFLIQILKKIFNGNHPSKKIPAISSGHGQDVMIDDDVIRS